ncbi:MAG: efflux RND transporter permease subunit [Hyphomicrobium sp.]
MNSIISFALKQRILILFLFLGFMIVGVFMFRQLNIEAYPDPTPPIVDIVTQVKGLSAEEVERYITIPIEVSMAGLPNLKTIRTISLFGLSDVKLQFTFEYSYEQALQQVLNRLAQLQQLPNGAQPQINPSSAVGEIYRYILRAPPGFSVLELKTLQDWVLQRRFRAIPGVIDVTGWGGKTKTYEIEVDLKKLVAYNLSLAQLLQTLNNSNLNIGGNTLNIGAQSAVVRGVGQIRSVDEIKDTMLTESGGTPVFVKDVANVSISYQPRLGIAGYNQEDDSVHGIVLMRRGEKSAPTLERVKKEIEKINSTNILPPGVTIERIYDRSDLINVTTHTVLHNMVVGILLIFILQWLFLGDLKSAVVVAATIPFALFFAITLLVLMGESANLLSVGAIDFGLIVDSTVIMVESIYRSLAEHGNEDSENTSAKHRLVSKLAIISDAASHVSRSILFASGIIIAAFVPLFTLSGVEGHIFGPMAKTYAFAIAGGLIATFTISPALSAILFKDNLEEHDTFLVKFLQRVYAPVVQFAISRKYLTLFCTFFLLLASIPVVRTLGLEFLPKLEEGNLYIRATFPSTISLEASNSYVNKIRNVLQENPYVTAVASYHGRPDNGSDATGFFNAEFFAPLKSQSELPSDFNKEVFTNVLQKKLSGEFPGIEFNFSQYLSDGVEEAVSGVKGENSIKLFGNNLNELTEIADQIKKALTKIEGISDLAVFTALGQPTVEIDIDRVRASRYGLSPGDINATIKTAIGGDQAGDLYEPGSDRRYPIIVRLAPEYRQSVETIKELTIPAQSENGTAQVPLKEVANVRLVSGATFIYRDNQERYLPIKFSVRGRDLGSTIQEAQAKIADQIQLPQGSRLEWVGQFSNLEEAIARLSIVVPISILLIGLLLFMNFGSFVDTLLGLSVIPMAVIGGVVSLLVFGLPFSISAAIGFIALFGIAVMDGIILINYYNRMLRLGRDRLDAILHTCTSQMRPVVMTCVIACVGLLPAAISTGIGSQVQKPLAVVVVGGMIFTPILILVVLPVLVLSFSRRKPNEQTLQI